MSELLQAEGPWGRDGALGRPRRVAAAQYFAHTRIVEGTRSCICVPPADARAGTAQRAVLTCPRFAGVSPIAFPELAGILVPRAATFEPCRGLGAGADMELFVDVPNVGVYGADTNSQLVGGFL
jgi:hypothetical protein